MKIYLKKGKKNYKENRMVKQLEEALMEKGRDPEFQKSFVPANNESELRALHAKYCAEDVAFEETKTTTKPEEGMAKNTKDADVIDDKEVIDATSSSSSSDSDSTFVDPFNREAPIVRDYVLGNDALGNSRTENTNPDNDFSEPTNFKDAFEIPDYDQEGKEVKEESQSSSSSGSSQTKSAPKPKPEPINPNFDSMENGKKKRSAKKFAKYVVEAVLMLSKQGFVWYANKDINPAKLAEYELNGEIDLNILVTLENGQEATIKEFFQQQCIMAEQLSEVSPTQKEDLIDSLTEVMLEKGIAPTPMQELGLIAASVFGGQAITLFALKSQSNSLLMQLKAMKKGEYEPEQRSHAQAQSAPAPAAPAPDETTFDNIDEQIDSNLNKNDIDTVIETKE